MSYLHDFMLFLCYMHKKSIFAYSSINSLWSNDFQDNDNHVPLSHRNVFWSHCIKQEITNSTSYTQHHLGAWRQLSAQRPPSNLCWGLCLQTPSRGKKNLFQEYLYININIKYIHICKLTSISQQKIITEKRKKEK